MQTSINLQEPATYSIIPLIIVFILIIIEFYYLFYKKNNKNKINKIIKNKEKLIPEKNIKNIKLIKEKYFDKLNQVENKYKNKIINLREAYQLISEIIRLFVFEITDITTQNYSLSEIKKLNIPDLFNLIKEYYEPEFSNKVDGNFDEAINKARRVIEKWK